MLLLPQLKNISPTWPTCFLFYEFVRVCASLKVVVSEASWLGGRQDSKSVWFQNALKYGLLDDSPNRLGRPGQLSIELNSHIYCKARLTAYLVIHVISCHIYSIYISYIHLSIYPPINLSIYLQSPTELWKWKKGRAPQVIETVNLDLIPRSCKYAGNQVVWRIRVRELNLDLIPRSCK